MSLELLVNKGVVFHNIPSINTIEKTIVVVGVARGGTSILAGALYHLGVFMGNANSPVFEDLHLSLAFEKKSKHRFKEVISAYNEEHKVWAWKRPSTLSSLLQIANEVRNPYFIFVFRDPLSIANRNTLSMKTGIEWGLKRALEDYQKMVEFISSTSFPSILVSSDKAVRNKNVLVDALIEFADLDVNDKQINAALNFITPDPLEYLNETRITKSKGSVNVTLLRTGLLRGWAKPAYSNDTVYVEVIINGKVINKIPANIYREHLDKPNIHPSGECGYELDLKPFNVQPSDSIEVRVVGDVVNLHVKPISFPKLKKWLVLSEVEGINK